MQLNQDRHTIVALLIEYETGNGRKTISQCPLTNLPQDLRNAIDRFNARPLDTILTDTE